MEEYKLIINSKSEKRIISRDEMEFIHLKFKYPSNRSINDSYNYSNNEIHSYCIICDAITGELIADLSERDYLSYQDEFDLYCTNKYRRCA